MDETNIGAVILSLRKQRGMTQEQLAEAVGVSPPAVSKWETCSNCPDVALLAPIARALDTVESDEFRARVAGLRNLYGDGRSSETAYQILKDTDFRELLLKTHDPLEVQV